MTHAVALLVALALQALPPPPPAPATEAARDAAERPGRFGAPAASERLDPRPPPAAVLERYRADPDFQYDRPRAAGPSLWARFWSWVWRTFVEPVFASTGPRLWRWTLIAGAVLLLGWVVTRLLRAEGGGVFGRADARRAEVGPLLDVEDLEAVDLGARLAAALDAGDYREAVRWRYLALLQGLVVAGLITWRRDATNRTYVAEVRAHDAALGRAVARATRVFDYVWYGERPVDKARYEALQPLFEAADPTRALTRTP